MTYQLLLEVGRNLGQHLDRVYQGQRVDFVRWRSGVGGVGGVSSTGARIARHAAWRIIGRRVIHPRSQRMAAA